MGEVGVQEGTLWTLAAGAVKGSAVGVGQVFVLI